MRAEEGEEGSVTTTLKSILLDEGHVTASQQMQISFYCGLLRWRQCLPAVYVRQGRRSMRCVSGALVIAPSH